MKRFIRFIRHCIVQRSFSRAMWVQEYEDYQPAHRAGK